MNGTRFHGSFACLAAFRVVKTDRGICQPPNSESRITSPSKGRRGNPLLATGYQLRQPHSHEGYRFGGIGSL